MSRTATQTPHAEAGAAAPRPPALSRMWRRLRRNGTGITLVFIAPYVVLFLVFRIGPAIAVECPHRSGAHVNQAEWTLSERDGELLISTAGPRAHQVTQAPTGVAGTLADGRCRCGRSGQRVILAT